MNDKFRFFDDNYKLYDKVRPGYPLQLFEDIVAYKPMPQGSRVMEIGIGTGKATQFFIDNKFQVASVEPGVKMAKHMRKKYEEYEDFSCYNMTYEKYMGMNNTFDLIYSGTAFHWVDEKTAYEKSFRLLKSGGALARFAYHANIDLSQINLCSELNKLYEKYMPEASEFIPFTEQKAYEISKIPEKYGFIDCKYHIYNSVKTFTSDEYINLLSTYPDHMDIDEDRRKEFFGEIKRVIVANDNKINISYIYDLELARKP